MTPENKATPGTNHCGYCGQDMLRGSDCRSSDDARVCGMYDRFPATHAVAGNNPPVTGEAAPAEGVKDDYKQWRDKLLELIAEYADVWRDYHQREAKWDQVEANRKAVFSHLAMGAQRGSAAPEPRQLTDSRCDYFAFEGRICNKCGRNHDGLGKPIWEGVRGSAALTDEQIVKTAVQVFGKYAYEARSLFVTFARALESEVRLAGDAACLNKGDSALLEQGAGDKSLVHPAVPSGGVASPSPLSSPLEAERSELPREPLTEDEIREAVQGAGMMFTAPDVQVARAIEAAHGIAHK